MIIRKSRPIAIALAGLLVIVLLRFVAAPLTNYRDSLHQETIEIGQRLKDVLTLKQQYQDLYQTAKEITIKKSGKPLFAQLENLARQAKVNKYVDFMRPVVRDLQGDLKEELVQVRFKGIPQRHLLEYLHATEIASADIQISTLKIKMDKNKRLDVDITFSMLVSGAKES